MSTPCRRRRCALPRATRFALFTVIVLLAMALLACGRKGPVRPRLQSLPAAPQDVTLQQRGESLLLGWTLPKRNLDGSPAADLARFRILRLAFAAGEACPTCREPDETVATIDLTYPEPAQRIGDRFYWFDDEVRPGYGFRYRIVPVTVGRRGGQPADIHRVVQVPPPAPTGLEATAGDRQVRLSWQAPPLPDDMERIGYNLYRRHVHVPFSPVPLNPEPLTETSLTDQGLDNGQAYEYRIGTLVRSGGDVIESPPTPGLLVTPQKR